MVSFTGLDCLQCSPTTYYVRIEFTPEMVLKVSGELVGNLSDPS